MPILDDKTLRCTATVYTKWYFLDNEFRTCWVLNQAINDVGFTLLHEGERPTQFIIIKNHPGVYYLPEKLEETFPTLSGYDVYKCSLKFLRYENFKKLYQLQVLSLNFNQLDYIGSNIFDDLTHLISLKLNNNRIEGVSSRAFRNLTKLETLRLEHNEIRCFRGDEFETLTNLTYLNLSHNRLETINKFLFRGLHSIKELLLYRNSIKAIEFHEDFGRFRFHFPSVNLNFNKCIDRLFNDSNIVDLTKVLKRNCPMETIKDDEIDIE